MIRDAAFHHAHENNRSAVRIKPGIKNQSLQRILGTAGGRGNAVNDGFEHIIHTKATFRADGKRVVRGNRENVFNLFFYEIDLRGGKINLVDDRKNREVVARSEKCVGNGLRFNTLRSVDDEQRAFASGERARNFVRKIHVARRIDQIQAIGIAIFGFVMEANAFRLDGDAALAFQVHGIENLRRHFALGEAARHFNQTIGKGGLAVIDMRDDAEISLELWVHVPVLPAGAEGRKPPARDF